MKLLWIFPAAKPKKKFFTSYLVTSSTGLATEDKTWKEA